MCQREFRFAIGIALALFLFPGCGSSSADRADVRGKISFGGQPLTAGTVTFVGDKEVSSGQIRDGEYFIPQAPVGPVKISVMTPPPRSEMEMRQNVDGKSLGGQQAKVVQVPANYNNADFSGLTYTVTKESPQTYDLIIN